jgi:hypothetical protein
VINPVITRHNGKTKFFLGLSGNFLKVSLKIYLQEQLDESIF